jgi:hypothetical protein
VVALCPQMPMINEAFFALMEVGWAEGGSLG